jgi:hypothetical protein
LSPTLILIGLKEKNMPELTAEFIVCFRFEMLQQNDDSWNYDATQVYAKLFFLLRVLFCPGMIAVLLRVPC